MKIVALIARILLGLIFLVFGANGLHPFLPMPPLPGGPAGQFIMALTQSHYAVVPFAVQFVGGLLLLVNRYVPLALALLGPVIVNIFCFHLCMDPSGLLGAFVVVGLWLSLFYYYRRAFSGIFLQRMD